MNVGDVMVTNVITVRPHASVQGYCEILIANRISAVPALDEADNLADHFRHLSVQERIPYAL